MYIIQDLVYTKGSSIKFNYKTSYEIGYDISLATSQFEHFVTF